MTDERIIAYLLKELPEEELEQFEDECFAQERWPSQINLAEEDLIDAYLRGELTQEQHQRFEQNYLTTEARQERVLMAAAILRHVDERQTAAETPIAAQPNEHTWVGRLRAFWSGQTGTLRAASAFAVVVIIAGAVWLSVSRTQSPRTFIPLTLTNSSTNRSVGAQVNKVNFPLDVDELRISLTLPERLPPDARYRVELDNLDKAQGETKPLEIVGQDARFVSVVIPAAQLTRAQYALNLFAIKTDGTEKRIEGGYFFNVE